MLFKELEPPPVEIYGAPEFDRLLGRPTQPTELTVTVNTEAARVTELETTSAKVRIYFHAVYGEFEATIEIRGGAVVGWLPKRALAHVQEWRRLHQSELLSVWDLARAETPLPRIEPLE